MNKLLRLFAICLLPGILAILWIQGVFGNGSAKKIALTGSPAAPQRVTLENSNDQQLQKFSEYQTQCTNVFSGAMIFLDFPVTADEARAAVPVLVKKLGEFSAFGIKPIVIMEPVDQEGKTISFADISSGKYDTALESYFSGLKDGGVTDRQMGLWAPLPEPNTDSWGEKNSDPAVFVAAYNKFGARFKNYFPLAEIGPLLDNETYLWTAGDTAVLPLDPYLNGIDRQFADSFGLQGFPWPYEGADGLETDYDALVFLPATRALDAAKILGTKSIWFNTGTFSSFRRDGKMVSPLAAGQRAQILDSILGQLTTAKDAGIAVTANIFAQDKSELDEGIDWSYWKDLSGAPAADGASLCEFSRRARDAGITLSVFDTK